MLGCFSHCCHTQRAGGCSTRSSKPCSFCGSKLPVPDLFCVGAVLSGCFFFVVVVVVSLVRWFAFLSRRIHTGTSFLLRHTSSRFFFFSHSLRHVNASEKGEAKQTKAQVLRFFDASAVPDEGDQAVWRSVIAVVISVNHPQHYECVCVPVYMW